MGNAGMLNMPGGGAMPYMTNNMTMGNMPMGNIPNAGQASTGGMPNANMPSMMKEPNANAMPYEIKPITGLMPEMGPVNMNIGMKPEMPPAKPNAEMKPEMMPAKPNAEMKPEMMPAKPNIGTMPGMNQPIIGAMPYMANPNMGTTNTGALPEMSVKPNANEAETGCGPKKGQLPPCAPLAVGYVPFQEKNPPLYEKEEALTKGTLFPGLDLPFKDIVNKTNPYAGTPMGELMALGFVIKELNLYLDTHPRDKDALDMLMQLNKLMQEGMDKFVALYGPQTIMDIMSGDRYTWIDSPWPWEYTEKGASDNHV
jgi:spore coat protein JB